MKTIRRMADAATLALIPATTNAGDICNDGTNPASPYNWPSTGASKGNAQLEDGFRILKNMGLTTTTTTFIPEPSSVASLSASFAGLAGLKRRSSKT